MQDETLVFLVDVDNTLLDNDRFQHDLRAHLAQVAGPQARDRYWAIQEGLFRTLGYRDYLGAFQTYRLERPDDADAIWPASVVIDYPFAQLLYPGALDVLGRMRGLARTVLLTDGDAVFQPRKLERSGLFAAADRQAMICVHKEDDLATIESRYPAQHYIVVDDKVRLLTAFKAAWGERVTTVFPRQGQFAVDEAVLAANPPADVTVERIGDLLHHPLLASRGASPTPD